MIDTVTEWRCCSQRCRVVIFPTQDDGKCPYCGADEVVYPDRLSKEESKDKE